MNILGISALTHDSGACLICDGEITFAVNEERLTRKKLQGGFPKESVRMAEEIALLKDIDLVVYVGESVSQISRDFRYPTRSFWKGYRKSEYFSQFLCYLLRQESTQLLYYINELRLYFFRQEFKRKSKGILVRIGHHHAHALCAYYTSGFENTIVFTLDKLGEDLLTGSVYIGQDGSLTKVAEVKWPDSAGAFYIIPIVQLGLRERHHAGKVTGLAAYGKPHPELMKYIGKIMWYKDGIKTSPLLTAGIGPFYKKFKIFNKALFRELTKYSKEEIAASFQKQLEDVVTSWVKFYLDKYKFSNICLAGGVFANIRLNQKIHELEGVDSIFIHPNMGDGGTGMGAALYGWIGYAPKYAKMLYPRRLPHVYLGPQYSEAQIEEELLKWPFSYTYCNDIERKIAQLLSMGKVVARFNGRMEYGPRALGNRTILYQTTDPTVNDWLNRKLKRSEFMPFAPATLFENATYCYQHFKGAEYTAKFMTITFQCSDYMKKISPGVVHLDGTARPQIITKEDNPSFYRILEEYYKITSIPSLINTSFNMHEEPIVCTPKDALKAFKQAKLDYLAMENFLVRGDGDQNPIRKSTQ